MKVTQWCLTLCDPMDYNLPGSSARGILQARILEWVARGVFPTRAGGILGLKIIIRYQGVVEGECISTSSKRQNAKIHSSLLRTSPLDAIFHRWHFSKDGISWPGV